MNIASAAPSGQARKRISAPICTDPLTDKELRRIPWLSPRAVELYVYLARIVQAKRRDKEMPFALVGFPAMAAELGCSIRSAKVAMDELKGYALNKVRLPDGKSQYVRQHVGYPLVRGWRLARRPGRKLVRVCSYALLDVKVDQLVEMSALLSSNLTCSPPASPPESAPMSAPVSALLSSNLTLASTGIKAAGQTGGTPDGVLPAAQEPLSGGEAGGKTGAKAQIGKGRTLEAHFRATNREIQRRGLDLLQFDPKARSALILLGDRVAPYELLDRKVQSNLAHLAGREGVAAVEVLALYMEAKVKTGKVGKPPKYMGKLLADARVRGELAVEEWEANLKELTPQTYQRGGAVVPTEKYHRPQEVRTQTSTPTTPEEKAWLVEKAEKAAALTVALAAGRKKAEAERKVEREARKARWAHLSPGLAAHPPEPPPTLPAGPQELGEVLGLVLAGVTADAAGG